MVSAFESGEPDVSTTDDGEGLDPETFGQETVWVEGGE